MDGPTYVHKYEYDQGKLFYVLKTVQYAHIIFPKKAKICQNILSNVKCTQNIP